MEIKETRFTYKELHKLIAPVTEMNAEDISTAIIITKGKCDRCGKTHGYRMIASTNNAFEVLDMLNEVVIRTITEEREHGEAR